MTQGDATSVYVFQQFDPRPIYHLPPWLVNGRRGDDEQIEPTRRLDDGGEEYLVACGLAWGVYRPEGNNTDRAIRIRWDHARQIGRMCWACSRAYYGVGVREGTS